MKTKFYAWATLFCLTGTLAAADAVSDWTGRDSKTLQSYLRHRLPVD